MSTTALAAPIQWENAQLLDTIKQTVCKGATDAQFRMFIEVCKATGLSPFLKEIYFVPSVGVMAGRDGYLRKANEDPQFDGMETRVERDERNIPIKAVCSVWRKDRSHPVICEAYFNEYQKQSDVWKKYPSAMIAKVAEVLALKRSFSINGVVTEDEIGNDEERGSKEAQKAYLADKGLTPYEREKKQLPPATKPEVIRELDNMLNKLPDTQCRVGPDKTIEMRHAAEVAEADAALKEVKKPVEKQRKTGAVTFDVLKHFGEIKKLLNEATGSDEAYYATLKAYSYQKSNEIKDNDQAREIYKALAGLHKRAQEDKKLRTELELAHMQYGVDFVDLLGVHACTSIDDVLLLSSDPLQALLAEIKDLGQRS